MPENVKTQARGIQTKGSEARAIQRIGMEVRVVWTVGAIASPETQLPTTFLEQAFETWGQTDILFGGSDLDQIYAELS